ARSPQAIGLALLMAGGSGLVRIAGSVLSPRGERLPSGLLAAAQLGLPAAAASLGQSTAALSSTTAAALVAGGCLTLIPATAGAAILRHRKKAQPAAPAG